MQRFRSHIALMTADALLVLTCARAALDNLRRFARDEALVGLVDRTRGQ